MTTAAKAWDPRHKAFDEVSYQGDAVSLCMLVNRRTRTVRVIDFRSGHSVVKRSAVLLFAQREKLEKVYTVVERDEALTWAKLGFTKEGTIPNFYKRSDAFVLGCSASCSAVRGEPEGPQVQSETRIVASKLNAGPARAEKATQTMERTIATAKRWLRTISGRELPQARLSPVAEAEARRAAAASLRAGRAITGFEPFGRDVVRRFFLATARAGFELYVSTESQACFAHGYIELLEAPRGEAQTLATSSVVRALCRALDAGGVVSCFSLAPSDDVDLAAVFLQNGFRRTGLLAGHLVLGGGERKDAILWSRKLAAVTDDSSGE